MLVKTESSLHFFSVLMLHYRECFDLNQSRLLFILLIVTTTRRTQKGLFKVQVPTKHKQPTAKKLKNKKGHLSLLKFMNS